MALRALLQHQEVRSRTPIILQHHPLHPPPTALKTFMQGLADANEERAVLQPLTRGLLLHGHLHRRVQRTIVTSAGELTEVGATSASLIDDREDRMSGFNLYEIAEGRHPLLSAFRLDPATESFVETDIPAEILTHRSTSAAE
jgi:hypothetical protein